MTSKEIRNNLGHDVIFDGKQYWFSAYTIRYLPRKEEAVPQCELIDPDAPSSIIIASPDKVQAIRRE